MRLDPARYWRGARCPVCKAPVDRWRRQRAVHLLRGEAPASAVRMAGVRITAAPAIGAVALVYALLLAGAFHLLGDRTWYGTVLLYSGRWIWLVPVLAVLPLVAIGGWRWLWLPTAAIWLLLNGVMGLETGWRRFGAAPDGFPLRVATYNVEGGDRVARRLREFVAVHRPDLLGLQECRDPLRRELAALLDGYHVDVSAGCLASRFPIDSVRAMPQSQFERVGGLLVTTYHVRTPGGPVALTNLHLETPRKGLEWLLGSRLGLAPTRIADNITLRDIESRAARRWVERARGPRLVIGDFNLPPDSRIYRASWSDLQNAWGETGVGFGYTRLSGWIRARIDHVLADEQFHVVQALVGADYGSDHLPLIADLVLRPR